MSKKRTTEEHALKDTIRDALAGLCILFNANVGEAWTGVVVEQIGGYVELENARRFSTGLPVGFPDLFGWTKDGRFLAIEVKTPTGVVSEEQEAFLRAVKASGGRAGVARSVADALAILAQP